jgi:D-sedoheptulose 7-phosphate isomerase
MLDYIKKEIQKTLSVIQQVEADTLLLETAQNIAQKCIAALRANGKILFAGNGGSAADSQHMAMTVQVSRRLP